MILVKPLRELMCVVSGKLKCFVSVLFREELTASCLGQLPVHIIIFVVIQNLIYQSVLFRFSEDS